MNKQIKWILLALALIAIALGIVLFMSGSITGAVIQPTEEYSWTKAICEGKSCVDVNISCNHGEVISMKPMSGVVTFSDSWKDSRTPEEQAELCK